jgi:hypothetical protein
VRYDFEHQETGGTVCSGNTLLYSILVTIWTARLNTKDSHFIHAIYLYIPYTDWPVSLETDRAAETVWELAEMVNVLKLTGLIK